MDIRPFDIIETKEAVLADNGAAADANRAMLSGRGVFFVNVMSSPGSGKTTMLLRTVDALKDRYRVGVMKADVDSDVDAAAFAAAGVPVIQVHTAGCCHMDADMTRRGLEALGTDGLDIVFLENVGNLVCPAEFDVGAHIRVMLLSVPEGDDKPLKYPLMFTVSDALLITKLDVAPVFDFDPAAAEERAKALNPDIRVIPLCSLTGEGFGEWLAWLDGEIGKWRAAL